MSLEADGVITIYEIETGKLIAVYEGLDVHQEITRLRAELAERDEEHRCIMSEPCAPDEHHCTCVPALRAENERLSSVLQQINDWCWTDDGAHALPCEPPWAKAMRSALDAAGGKP